MDSCPPLLETSAAIDTVVWNVMTHQSALNRIQCRSPDWEYQTTKLWAQYRESISISHLLIGVVSWWRSCWSLRRLSMGARIFADDFDIAGVIWSRSMSTSVSLVSSNMPIIKSDTGVLGSSWVLSCTGADSVIELAMPPCSSAHSIVYRISQFPGAQDLFLARDKTKI